MPTSSFDKVIVLDKESLDKIIDSLINDKPRKIDTSYLSEENQKKAMESLRIFYEEYKNETGEEQPP